MTKRMQEQPYTQDPQLDRFLTGLNADFTGIKNDINDGFKGVNDHLTKLNSKVATHEQLHFEHSKWRERINGMAIAASVLLAIIVLPLLGWALFEIRNIPDRINKALSAYEVIE